jgi:hypothetical protein
MLSRFLGLALLAFALPLGGCVTDSVGTVFGAVNGVTITQGQIDAARASYIGLFLTPAAAYRCVSFNADKTCNPRPICAVDQTFLHDQCATKDAITKIQGTTKTLSTAMNSLQAQFNAGNNTGLYAAYAALQAGITAAAGLITTFEGN